MAKLYIIGTPIGNLKDITYRAVETLSSADIIACEDTRHSLPLLNRYEIKTKLVAYHKFNEAECSERLLGEVENGKNVALITDAGMPSISDPGAELIRRAYDKGVDVELVPGPTAFASAITLSGIKSTGFTFLGFLPEKSTDKTSILSKVSMTGMPFAIYVAPHDVKKTAEFIYNLLGDRKVWVVREITKLYESVTRTSLANFECEERGEMVMIVDGADDTSPLNSLSVQQHIAHYVEMGMDKKSAVKQTAADRGVPKNEIYKYAVDMDV